MNLKIKNNWLRALFILIAFIWIIMPDPIPFVDDLVLVYLIYKQLVSV